MDKEKRAELRAILDDPQAELGWNKAGILVSPSYYRAAEDMIRALDALDRAEAENERLRGLADLALVGGSNTIMAMAEARARDEANKRARDDVWPVYRADHVTMENLRSFWPDMPESDEDDADVRGCAAFRAIRERLETAETGLTHERERAAEAEDVARERGRLLKVAQEALEAAEATIARLTAPVTNDEIRSANEISFLNPWDAEGLILTAFIEARKAPPERAKE